MIFIIVAVVLFTDFAIMALMKIAGEADRKISEMRNNRYKSKH